MEEHQLSKINFVFVFSSESLDAVNENEVEEFCYL